MQDSGLRGIAAATLPSKTYTAALYKDTSFRSSRFSLVRKHIRWIYIYIANYTHVSLTQAHFLVRSLGIRGRGRVTQARQLERCEARRPNLSRASTVATHRCPFPVSPSTRVRSVFVLQSNVTECTRYKRELQRGFLPTIASPQRRAAGACGSASGCSLSAPPRPARR